MVEGILRGAYFVLSCMFINIKIWWYDTDADNPCNFTYFDVKLQTSYHLIALDWIR